MDSDLVSIESETELNWVRQFLQDRYGGKQNKDQFGNIMVAIQTQVSYHFHLSILTYPTNKKYSSAQTFAIFASLSG